METVFSDSSVEHMLGVNEMDLSMQLPAAEDSSERGAALTGRLAEFRR